MLDSNEVPTFNHYSQLHTIGDIGLNEIRASKSQLCYIHFKVIPFGDIGPNGERFPWNFNPNFIAQLYFIPLGNISPID